MGSKEAKEEENAKAFRTGTDTPFANLFGWNQPCDSYPYFVPSLFVNAMQILW